MDETLNLDGDMIWHSGMTRKEEEIYFSEFFKRVGERERVENIRIGIAENSTGRVLKNAFIGLVTGKTPEREKPRAEPWLPEYDDVMLSFWTPKETKAFREKGFTKSQLVKHTKNYIADNAWKMEHWKTQTKEEYMKEFNRNPTLYSMEIVHFKDSKRGIPLTEWGYPDLKNTKINREELLGITPSRLKADNELEQAVRNGFKKEAATSAQKHTVDGMLLDSVIGKQALNVLGQNGYSVDFAPLRACDSAVNPTEKKLTLNSILSDEANALSVISVACRMKQQKNNATPAPQMDMDTYLASTVVCKADVLASQLVFAEEMRQKNPKILSAFKMQGNADLCDKFEASFAESDSLNSARSAAIDGYLEKSMPMKEANRLKLLQDWKAANCNRTESLSSKEMLEKTCKGFDGASYYNGSKAAKDKFNVRSDNKVTDISPVGSYNAFIATLKASKGR
ncbi:MAG: hypothetical protein IKR09_04930 [Alphaproteobacteria bacterium]|nr:hypothetical protein [Alphaproteobacteria bacterium]